MFNNIKNKIAEKIEEAEKKQKEKERLEKERLEKEKQKLLALDEKELLVELILSMKNVEKGQKALSDKLEDLDSAIWSK